MSNDSTCQRSIVKTVVSIFYYLLIFICCLAGAYLAKRGGFIIEVTFLIYVAMVVYATTEMIFKRISFLKTNITILRILFLVICITSTYLLLVTTEEMILNKELNTSIDALDTVDINIETKAGAYLANIKFEISNEQFLDLVDTLSFKKVSSTEITLNSPETRNVLYSLMENENAGLYFVKDESVDEYSPIDIKYLIYDTETMIAYYEHMNYKEGD